MAISAQELDQKLAKIKFFALDVDGVLTDGSVFLGPDNTWTRIFNVRDGYGIRMMVNEGFKFGVLSGGSSSDLKKRLEYLGIEKMSLGDESKVDAFEKFVNELGLDFSETAYIGDELFDIPVLEKAGLSISVPNGSEEVKRRVDYVTKLPGGKGAVREVIDLIRRKQKIGPYLD